MSAVLLLIILMGVVAAMTAGAYSIGYRDGRRVEAEERDWQDFVAGAGNP